MTKDRQFTRRHWGREVLSLYKDLTGFVRGSSGKLSAHRIVLIAFSWQFVRHWPGADQWMDGSVYALLILAFAMPVSDLMAIIPAKEALAAVAAFFSSVGGKAVDMGRRVATRRAPDDRPDHTVPTHPDEDHP